MLDIRARRHSEGPGKNARNSVMWWLVRALAFQTPGTLLFFGAEKIAEGPVAQIQLELVVCFELVTVQQFGERGLTRLVFRYPEDLPDPEAARDELANALFKAAEQIASGGALEGSLRDTRFEIGRLKIVDRRERRPSPTPA